MRNSALRWNCWCALVTGAVAEPRLLVAIQPLGPVPQADVERVRVGVEAFYAVKVEVLPQKPLPKAAYYEPRDRYNADDVIDVLSAGLGERFDKVLGLTARDISVINDEGKDWGVMGLGQLGGKACLVSTFRLRSGKAAPELFAARLAKVVNHELGHTFGIDHCQTPQCLMQDKRGKIATVDGESGKPCAVCAARLPLVK